MKKDFWNSGEEGKKKVDRRKGPRKDAKDEALILSLIAILVSDEKNSGLVMALLYILS